MKIWYFMQWQWRQFETWQRFWLLAMFLGGCAFTAPDHYKAYFILAAGAIVLSFVLKWIFYDGVMNAWHKFNQEQEKMVDIMRDGK